MTILTIENRCKVASAVTGKEHVAMYAPAIQKHEIVPWVDGFYDWDNLWKPEIDGWQWLLLVGWVSGRLVKLIKDGDWSYENAKPYEFMQAISDDDSGALEEFAFELID